MEASCAQNRRIKSTLRINTFTVATQVDMTNPLINEVVHLRNNEDIEAAY